MSTWILFSKDSESQFAQQGGGKAANLAKLTKLGIPVPRWFCVSTHAFDQFIQANGLESELALRPDTQREELAMIAARIEAKFLKAEVPAEVVESIRKAFDEIGVADALSK